MNMSREPFANLALYYLFKWSVVSPVFYTYFRGKVIGFENVPQQNPFIVVCNHASYFDPLFVSCAMGRPIAYMAKEELFSVPILSQAIQFYGAYPVKRGAGDRGAIRAALQAIEKGWGLGIFLEGTRTENALITNPKLGAVLIAAKAHVPLLPVSLRGTNRILKKGLAFPQPVPITVRIGTLIAPPINHKRETLEALTQQCATEINRLYHIGR